MMSYEDPKMLSLICYIENLTDKKVSDYCSIPIEQFFSDIMAILIMMSILYYTNTMSLILIVLFPLLVDMSLHFDTSF